MTAIALQNTRGNARRLPGNNCKRGEGKGVNCHVILCLSDFFFRLELDCLRN